MEKRCANCGIVKDVSCFGKNKRNSDGLHSYCKECNKLKAKQYNKTEKGRINCKKIQQKQFQSGYFKFGHGAIINMSNSAKKRNIDFSLTENELSVWWHNLPDVCEYCNTSINDYIELRNYILNYNGTNWKINRFKKFYDKDMHKKTDYMTIDRIDSFKGYCIENIVKSCWICNSLKSNFYSYEEMKMIGKILINQLKEEINNEKKI